MTYNYLEAVKEDVKEAIKERYSTEELKEALETMSGRRQLEEVLNDDLWIDDSVTGNASGSYTFNTYQAEENICHNLELLKEALDAFCGDYEEALEKGAEYCDVTIRCYLLGQAISEALDELESEID